MLNTKTLPEVKYDAKTRAVNSVLALWKMENYDETNTYLSPWHITNTVFYLRNRDKYEGWVELEEIHPNLNDE